MEILARAGKYIRSKTLKECLFDHDSLCKVASDHRFWNAINHLKQPNPQLLVNSQNLGSDSTQPS